MADTETEDTTPALRSQMHLHEGFVEWATGEGYLDGSEDQATTIAVFAAKRNAYRKTEFYDNLKAEHAEEVEAAKEAKAAEREAAKAEKAAAKAAAEAEKAAKAKSEKPAKKTAAKKTTAKRTASKKASAAEADPFG